jgi:hypothetical protein
VPLREIYMYQSFGEMVLVSSQVPQVFRLTSS